MDHIVLKQSILCLYIFSNIYGCWERTWENLWNNFFINYIFDIKGINNNLLLNVGSSTVILTNSTLNDNEENTKKILLYASYFGMGTFYIIKELNISILFNVLY